MDSCSDLSLLKMAHWLLARPHFHGSIVSRKLMNNSLRSAAAVAGNGWHGARHGQHFFVKQAEVAEERRDPLVVTTSRETWEMVNRAALLSAESATARKSVLPDSPSAIPCTAARAARSAMVVPAGE